MEKQPNPPLTMGIFGYVAQVGGHYISFWSNIDYLYQLRGLQRTPHPFSQDCVAIIKIKFLSARKG